MSRCLKLGVSISLFACTMLLGDELPRSFTLGRYIPDDACVYFHDVYNPERDFIAKHWERVIQAIGVCGIDVEIKQHLNHLVAPPDRVEFDRKWKAVHDAIRDVRWAKLGQKEFAYAHRLIPLIPQHILLFRNDPAETEALANSLAHLLETLASLSPKLTVRKDTLRGATVWTIREAPKTNLAAQLFRRDDVIGLVSDTRATRVVLAMMDGRRTGRSIVDTSAFKTAMASVERPEDGVGFVRVALMQEQIRTFFDAALARASNDEGIVHFKRLMFKALAHTDFVDHIALSRSTDGVRETWHKTIKLRPDHRKMPLARAFIQRKKFESFDRFVPREAKGFSASTFVDLGLIYNTVIEFIRNEIPDEGPRLLQGWEQLQHETLGIDFNRDIFSWLSGEFVVVNLPTMTEAEINSVAFVRVKDAELARKKVATALDWLAENGRVFNVMVSPAPEVEAGGFRAAFHPMLAIMRAKPVLGIYEDWLVLGSSPQAVNKCIATSKGLRSSIRKNARFREEGLPTRGGVNSVTFADQSRFGESLATGCMVANMLSGMAADSPELQLAFRIASRLAPVFAQLNFFDSTATTFSFEGDIGKGRSILTYKAPPGFAKAGNALRRGDSE